MIDKQPIIRPDFAGTPSVRGSRLNVFHIMDHYLARRSIEWVADFYHVPVGDAAAAYEYIASHEIDLRARYDAILERRRELVRQSRSPELEAKFASSQEKMLRRRAELEQQLAKRGSRDARAAE